MHAHLSMLDNSVQNDMMCKAQQAEYENIDQIMVEAKHSAEWSCRKIKAGGIPWCLQVPAVYTTSSIEEVSSKKLLATGLEHQF